MSSSKRRRTPATEAPPPRPLAGPDELWAKLIDLFAAHYELQEPTPFMVFLEGTTDLRFLLRAVDLAREEGHPDPLRVPTGVARSEGERITLCSPGRPGSPYRGGIPQMVRLAQDLQPYVFTLEAFGGVLFVFDGDKAGAEAIGKLESMGYTKGQHMIALSKKAHPNACGDRGLVIEDLLSLEVQKSFFAQGGASCEAVYSEGALTRFRWHHASKSELSQYVASKASLGDLREIVRLVERIRSAFGFA